ncbi:ATP-binding cassette domain-containing protein [Paenibacillus sp. P25]|nr:ATP-binding cassette domain-containing protein [Paenibacillus sp. P25]
MGAAAAPYFPSQIKVLDALIHESGSLAVSTLYSLRLLVLGYAIGTILGLTTGILMGWYQQFRYWVNPFIRILGPIPSTAWIPIVLVVFPTSFSASVFLLVLATWFPVTVMTWTGISNVSKSYFEVAKTLGANEQYLIRKVAIPAAFPQIFIGLFMGTGTSFVTLIVAEMLGVKAGLGFYITWAQGWGEYYKVYAALFIMASAVLRHHHAAVLCKGQNSHLAERADQMVAQAEAGAISVSGVSRIFTHTDGTELLALNDVHLEIKAGEFVSLIGPSGRGKSTLLRLIAGLDRPSSGQLTLDGQLIEGAHYTRGLVFQEPTLFPWKNVWHNVASGLEARGLLGQLAGEVDKFIELVGLKGFEKVYPHMLSGGMAQRAALARALVNYPKVLLAGRTAGRPGCLHPHEFAG